MVIRKLYVPPTVAKTNPAQPPVVDPNFMAPSVVDPNFMAPPVVDPNFIAPPVVDPNGMPPATAYQPPAEDVPIIVEPEGSGASNGPPLVFADAVELDVVAGKIVGRRKPLPNGSEYYSYQGIPYAKPPVGELRFKPPVPLDQFDEQPLQCGSERGHCLAIMALPEGPAGVEDCLYLNVYTTSGPGDALGMLKPVMVWIHGGGYYTGSGNADFFGPDYLLQHGVVLVTLNYRLGPLGFLALPSVGIHGNQGLKDQQLALRWVQENIARFGGDPSNVTLFGESAGSASVNWHYLCPKSRQYFHKAICQSGSVFCPWGLQYQPEGRARKLAAVLGYEGEDDAGVLATLQNASAEELVSNSTKAFEESESNFYCMSPFIPCIEDPSSEDAIIPQRGEELLKQPNVTNVPLIHGVTSGEGLVFYGLLQQRFDEVTTNLASLLPLDLGIPRDFAPAVIEEIRQFYFQDKPIERDGLGHLLDLVGDVGFYFPVYAAAELHSRFQQEAPLYFYRFSYESELNVLRKQFSVPDGTPGAAHADELSYLFNGSQMNVPVEAGSVADQGRTLLCRLWTNFAKYGQPTPEGEDVGFQWDPLPPTAAGEPFVLRALDLNEQVQVVENPMQERIQFWRSLAERFNPNLVA
uniref:Carboxylic ester hydrolase n=1 Tax=Anopheles melas TaxID=34690 RepID=A0A182TUY4_9DIPT